MIHKQRDKGMIHKRISRGAAYTVAAALLASAAGPALAQGAGGAVVSQRSGAADGEVEPHLEAEPTPDAGSANVIYIVLDDTGFADLGSFGSEIRTPAMDSLAQQGLRFNNFHTRAICSPTRAALLTGRNSHSVGVANVTNMLSGYPHGQGKISRSAATIAEVLQSSGYRTFALGKWHLSPMQLTSNRAEWPLARGFDQFYGFLNGMTDQYYPDIVVDNTPTEIKSGKGYHLSEDLVDKAIGYIGAQRASSPERPFFLYLAFGATHGPHQVPEPYISKYLDIYGKGWDKIREERFARQKALGVIPADAGLAPLNPDVKAWAALSEMERQVNIRFQATYAGMLEHTDQQIGRLIDFLKKTDQYKNTMIVLISDNGASVEGHETGTWNEVSSLNRVPETPQELFARKDSIGTEKSYPNYPSGWAQVSNTPFRLYKTTLWDGGVRAPLIIYQPKTVTDPGRVRQQFVDVVDITPTVLDLLQLKAPTVYKGVEQMPLAGASIKAALSDARAPASRNTQYFELLGQRAIWHDGWKAISVHQHGTDFAKDSWHLYDTRSDFSALNDLARSHPQKVAEMQDRWLVEAKKFGVLPLVDAPLLGSFTSGAGTKAAPKYKTSRDPRPEYVYYGGQAPVIAMDSPQLGSGSFSITAQIAPSTGREAGVLIADGDRFGGYSLYVLDGHAVFEQSDLGRPTKLRATKPIPAGTTELRYTFERTDPAGGTGTLFYAREKVASGRIARRATNLTAVGGFGIGRDVSGPVSEDYPSADGFPLAPGVLERVVVRGIDASASAAR